MKIVHVETGRRFYGGAQQVVWLMDGLQKAGVTGVLVCPPGAAVEREAGRKNIRIVNVPCAGEHDFRFPFRLARVLRKERPDLLHCHSRRGADFPGGWAATLARKPAVVTRRVDSAEAPTAAWLRYRPFDRVVAISEHIAEVLGKSAVRGARVQLIRSAVDADAMQTSPERVILRREFGIRSDDVAIAVVAQLIKRKGHRFLLDVLPGLLDKHPNIRVVLFGEGRYMNDIKDLAARLGVVRSLHFPGFREDLDDYLGAFDLLVHPAEKEGLGVAMLKAAAAEVPVIAFDVAGCREAVEHMKTGVLVPPGDLSALQIAIGTLIEAPDVRADLGEAGRERMLAEFRVDTMVESYVNLYEDLLNGQ